jgi:type I restriction enzyme S subunit
MVTCIGNIGRVSIATEMSVTNQQINSVIPTDAVEGHYLMYSLCSPHSQLQMQALSSATTVAILNKARFSSLPIPVAPIEEQRRIVDAIEEHFSRIDAAEKSLRYARKSTHVLRRLMLERSIGPLQPTRRLAEVATTQSGGTPSRGNPAYFGGDIPWIKSGELGDGEVSATAEAITPLALKESSAKLIKRGTLLMAMYGATIGKLGVVGMESAATNQAVCAITPNDPASTDYLWQVLLWKRPELVAQGKGGAQPNISQGLIRDLLIPYPPIADQERVVAQVQAANVVADRVNDSVDKALSRIPIVRQTLLLQAFSGKLVAQDPDEEPASVLPERKQGGQNESPGGNARRKKVTA